MQKSTHATLRHRLLLMLLSLFLGFTVAAQDVLLTQSFESGGAMPTGWGKTTVSGSDALSFVTSTSWPSGFTAYNGSYLVCFGSFNYGSGTVNRLRTTTPISTVGKTAITVHFAWLHSTGYSSSNDRVTIQYSTDGNTWINGGTYSRYNGTQGWALKNDILPSGVENQPIVYIGFLFTSEYGNDCYLDDVTVYGTPSGPPPVTFQIGAGTSTCNYPFNTYWHDSRTQMLYTAAELTAAGALPGQITAFGFNVSSFSSQTMNGFNIDMQNYAGSTISSIVTSGWTNVYSGAVTLTSSGWRIFNLSTPFEWDGTSNLLVNVCFDNTSYTSASYVYGTASTGTTVHMYTDGATGCSMTGGYTYSTRPNVQITLQPNAILPTGILQGFVMNAYGVPLGSAYVTATGENGDFETLSAPNGSYSFPDITIGSYTVTAVKPGYNPQTFNNIIITDGGTTYQNFNLTQPSLAVTPNPYSVILNPNEMYDGAFNLANNGNGPVTWTAEIEYTEPPTQVTGGQGTDFSQLTYVENLGEGSSIPGGNGEAMSSRDLMSCPDGSKFSLPPVGSNNGYTSTTGSGYKCYQQFLGATGSFKTLTFWAIFTSAPPATMNFNIEVYGPGSSPTTLLGSLPGVAIAPVNTGVPVIGYSTYQFTVDIGSYNIPDGWISVQSTSASPTFYWLNSMSGVGTALQQSGSSYSTLPEKLAMCLSGQGGGWLTLGSYEGTVNAFSNFTLPAFFNAEGTEAGEIYTANVTFTSDPNVGTIVVPVTMTIAGPALAIPEDLTATLTNPIEGTVALSWTFAPTDAFQYFVVKRDGSTLGTTTGYTFADDLPTYGVYEYSVQAVYDEGASSPATVELEWPNPTMFVDPTYIYDEVWVNNQATQTVTISNTGEGTLAFQFPDWVPDDNTREPLAYCSASGGCDEYISNVTFNTINNSSSCSQYANYTSIVTELEIGETYPITVTNPVPYSSDIVGIYIDWNHNEVFTDAGEFFTTTSSGGGASFTTNILVPETALSGPTRMRVRLQWGGTLSSCGSTSYGEVEDYTVDVGMPGFITSVVPYEGTIPEGESRTITITWDATDFDPGFSYFEDLEVTSNDLAHPSVIIENEMYVYTPGQFAGTVTDIETGEPLNGVVVTANPAGYMHTYIVDDGTNENGFGYTSGSTGSIGQLIANSDEGVLTQVEAYFYAGAAMTTPLTVEIYDAAHNLLGVSDPVLVNNVGWYTFTLPNIPYEGNFYVMMHWPNITGSTRYMGWDSNGPNINANLTYEIWNGIWYSFATDYAYYGTFLLRPTALVTGSTQAVTYNAPASQGKSTSTLASCNVPGNAPLREVNNSRDLVSFQTITDDQGEYSLYVDPGLYNVSFEKTGYQTYIEYDTIALANIVTPLDAQLREESYPPSFVYAEVNAEDTEVLVTWGDGMGPYEIIYDDGSAENFAAWALPGNMNGVKFTPASYPATVVGGKVYVGDGSFPNNNTGFLGTTFGMMVLDDDGPNGLPGTVLDSVSVEVSNYGWLSFSGLNAEITDGNFYLAMVQGGISPNIAPIGVDQQNPIVYRSYSRNVVAGQGWALSPYQDFMLRAVVFGSPATDVIVTDEATGTFRAPAKQRGMISLSPAMAAAGGIEGKGIFKAANDFENGSRSVTGYRVVRYSNFDPNGDPETGTITNLANNVQGNEFTDTQWASLPGGWYAYGVAARYPDNYVSDTIISNIVGHHIDAEVTVNVALTTGGSPAGAFVSLTGLDYPYEVYSATVPESGQVIFPEVWYGHYDFHAEKVGFDDYDMSVNITGNRVINIILAERKYKPRNLYVDPLTLVATWDEPLAIAVIEDFEGATFPPAGWQATTQNTTGWYATTNGSSASWTIPPHTKYAVTNDDADNGNGCCDYLITPEMDWTNLPTYRLNFASFYDGSYSQSAYVEISTDAGATWTVIYTLSPAPGAWQNLEIDLQGYSGASGLGSVWVAFHADDNGQWASGWAVDDVQISSGGVPHQGYGVFLDGTLVGNTLLQTYTYTNLNYGQEYLAGVAALYSSGYSELDTYLFRSVYLIPPTNLEGVNPPQTDYVHLTWVAPTVPVDYTVTDAEARTEMPIASAEYSPTVRNVTYADNNQSSRDVWDILFAFNAQAASMPGIETDGDYIYISNWQGTNFGKYEVSGTWVEDFTISGVANIRDMAYDGEFFYGGQASTTIYKMNFNDYTLAGTIPSAVSVRHIAYDPEADGGDGGFWAGNWSDLALINMSGGLIQSVSIPLSGVYGSAYDGNTDGGPFLWLFDQNGSGVDIHQFEIATTSFTGLVHAATDIPGFLSGSIAGGLASSSTLISGKFVLVGNIQQDPNLLFGYELGDASTTGQTVANLLGYNIYRDDAMIAYVPKPALEYFDLNLDPGTYTYHITAVYDLTPYGYAGQTGESMIEGPIDVTVVYGYELPFTENWNTGVFETNQWTMDGENWVIAGQSGNPAPSAMFTYSPVQTEYALSLNSYWINGTGFVDGKIYADFDLKLDDNTATGEEQLMVEVFNGAVWVPVATYTAEGDMDWEMKHVDITNSAKGKVFRVRFTAKGMNSLDIINWQVDNINIYRLCEAPTELVASIPSQQHKDQILLEWVAPTGGNNTNAGWLEWDNGENNDAIGLTGGGTFLVGVRFTPDQLAQYAGTSLTKIRMFPYQDGATFVLKVWTGANASQLVLSQPIASYTAGQWNEFILTTPVPVTGTTELWFGYSITHGDGVFAAGVDAGPAVAGYGDMISLDGSVWESMSSAYALDFNWNLGGYVEGIDAAAAPLQPIADNTVYGPVSQPVRGFLPHLQTAIVPMETGSRELTGYNIFRDGEFIANTTETEYLDTDPAISVFGEEFCYYVTAVYEDCESGPSNTACEVVESAGNLEIGAVKLYPNPANSVVNIELTNDISQLMVYDYLGQVVYQYNVTKDKTIQLDVRNYEAGAYLIKFITRSGESFAKKIAVTK